VSKSMVFPIVRSIPKYTNCEDTKMMDKPSI